MASTHVLSVVIFATFVTYCLCLPIKSDKDSETVDASKDVQKVLVKDVNLLNRVVPEVEKVIVTESDSHMIVKRSKRAGIISSNKCATDHWRMPNGQCAPCNGQNYPGCGSSDYSEDYDEDNEVEKK